MAVNSNDLVNFAASGKGSREPAMLPGKKGNDTPAPILEDVTLQPVIDEKDLQKSVQNLERMAQSLNHKLSFRIDKELNRVIVQVQDANGKVIKQIPQEEMVKFLHELKHMIGLLIDENV